MADGPIVTSTELSSVPEHALRAASSVKEACAAVVSFLRDELDLMPSIYLERGGRLRCQAAAGYWQVFDGIPPSAGVIGCTFTRNEPMVIDEPRRAPEYLEAASVVRSEVCVPVRRDGRPVGALNVESDREVGVAIVPLLEACAEALMTRIEELGGLPAETPSERLLQHVSELSGLVDAASVVDQLLVAACEVGEMESALVVLPAAGRRAAWGPRADELLSIEHEHLERIASWVSASTSVHTVGARKGHGFDGHERLRATGAQALVVVPLTGQGFLLLVDPLPIALDTEDIELIELLAGQANSALATATAIEELNLRASTDPLTGLLHHASFHHALERACERPERRGRLVLMLMDLDHFKRVNDTHGHLEGDGVLRRAATALQGAARPEDLTARVGGDEFAALMTLPDTADPAAPAERIRAAVVQASGDSLSLGVAVKRPGESAHAFLSRADRALYRAKGDGRDRSVVDAD